MAEIDLDAATRFMAKHGRLLDRRRLELLLGSEDATGALAALDGYRNADGGYGWGIEPDLRSPESQPAGALHAFEVLAEAAPVTSERSTQICDWLTTATLPDGGLPFARPVTYPDGCAPFWATCDGTESSLHITTAVCSMALRVARHDAAVADHPWLETATRYCIDAIEQMSTAPHAIELMYILHFLDAVSDARPEALDLLRRTASAHLPPDGTLQVAGGLEDERLHPLDFSPEPGRPLRSLIDADAIDADLDRWRGGQQDDGGWVVDFASSSPMGTLEWRGYATVRAVALVHANR